MDWPGCEPRPLRWKTGDWLPEPWHSILGITFKTGTLKHVGPIHPTSLWEFRYAFYCETKHSIRTCLLYKPVIGSVQQYKVWLLRKHHKINYKKNMQCSKLQCVTGISIPGVILFMPKDVKLREGRCPCCVVLLHHVQLQSMWWCVSGAV
jgi:hypothetical protein